VSGRCASAHLLKPFSWLVLSEMYITLVSYVAEGGGESGWSPRAVMPVCRPAVAGSSQPPEARTSPVAVTMRGLPPDLKMGFRIAPRAAVRMTSVGRFKPTRSSH
jgi:hypothetical protein